MHKTFALDFLQSMKSIWALSLHTDRSVKVPHIQHPHCCVSIYQLMIKKKAIFFQKDFTFVVLDEEQRSKFYVKKKRQDAIIFQKEGNKSSALIWMKKREEGFKEKKWTKKREE